MSTIHASKPLCRLRTGRFMSTRVAESVLLLNPQTTQIAVISNRHRHRVPGVRIARLYASAVCCQRIQDEQHDLCAQSPTLRSQSWCCWSATPGPQHSTHHTAPAGPPAPREQGEEPTNELRHHFTLPTLLQPPQQLDIRLQYQFAQCSQAQCPQAQCC